MQPPIIHNRGKTQPQLHLAMNGQLSAEQAISLFENGIDGINDHHKVFVIVGKGVTEMFVLSDSGDQAGTYAKILTSKFPQAFKTEPGESFRSRIERLIVKGDLSKSMSKVAALNWMQWPKDVEPE